MEPPWGDGAGAFGSPSVTLPRSKGSNKGADALSAPSSHWAPICLAASSSRVSSFLLFDRELPLRNDGPGQALQVAYRVGNLIMTWCVEKKGPVFTAAFIPTVQIMVATIDFFFLHEQIYLGSVLGSVLMILGLYLVLWGKERDEVSVSCPTTTDKHVDEQADDKP
ncbi:Auxin-induced protein 5NG4 [Hordeum vulgare]|nr:Auxin-induced protein 5NG4 [Hordeum vulgare]